MSYNDLNQVLNFNGNGLTYDARGNALGDGTNSFTFDILNRLKTVNGSQVSLQYDPLGRMYQETSSGSTVRMAYDGSALIAEFNTSGTVQRRYVHGSGADEALVW